MEIITRKKYIDRILSFLNKGMIIALTGQRRLGKSYILRDLANLINESYQDANIIYINKDALSQQVPRPWILLLCRLGEELRRLYMVLLYTSPPVVADP